MSNRSIRKVRHFRAAPSFKERVHAGMLKQTKELWEKYGWGTAPSQPVYEAQLEVVAPAEEHEHVHVHGPGCHHE